MLTALGELCAHNKSIHCPLVMATMMVAQKDLIELYSKI